MPNAERLHTVTFEINGAPRTVRVEGRRLLVHVIREDLELTGTHVGCDTSQCGACTVEIDGKAVKSCTVLAVMAEGSSITTIEGLSKIRGTLDPVQAAFHDHHALQCGFCTPGMLMTARWLLDHNPDPDEAEIREVISGQICRCTGYENIVRSVRWAAKHSRRDDPSDAEASG